jgi:glucan phosphoethanolaminetransferase (alkaline phosphatase superfamily)
MTEFLVSLVNLLVYEALALFVLAMFLLSGFGFIVFIVSFVRHWKSSLRAASLVILLFMLVVIVSAMKDKSIKKERNQPASLYNTVNTK